jgi:hypothetical protein
VKGWLTHSAYVVALCLLPSCQAPKVRVVTPHYVAKSNEVSTLVARAKVERERAWAKKDYEEYNYYVGVIDGLRHSIKK